MSLRIDAEFRRLIPPLREEERAQLEENLAANGCRDPLVLWRGILIDGHNRHEICERLKIKYRTVEIVLASRAHVLLWIEENQLGRRNLTDDQRSAIALAVKKRRAAMAEVEKKARAREVGKQGGRGKKKTHGDTVSPRVSERTRPAVAREARVPERKLRAVAEVEKKAGPEAVERIRAGESTIQQERTAIRRIERMEKIAALSAPPPLTSERKYPVLLVDPPWKYDYVEADSRAIENQYPTMTLEQICLLEVPKISLADSVLFLWVTNPKLAEAFAVLKAWGFDYRTNMVWVKDKIGMGYYVRAQHELLLIAKRGELPVPEPFDRPPSVLTAPRAEHSAKPEAIYKLIERMYPNLPKIELFARGARREGWSVWGNQSEAGNA
jgi:N6-adenosine-specific RNA methylase IME4